MIVSAVTELDSGAIRGAAGGDGHRQIALAPPTREVNAIAHGKCASIALDDGFPPLIGVGLSLGEGGYAKHKRAQNHS